MIQLSLLKKKEAFTLIEMLIVLMIISILLLIAIPSMTKSNQVVKEKSCEATIKLVQSQVAAYNIAHDTELTNLNELVSEGYVDSVTCPDGVALTLVNGKVVKAGSDGGN